MRLSMSPAWMALLAGSVATAAAGGGDDLDCLVPGLADPVACRDIVVEYDPTPGAFDGLGLAARHNLRVVGSIPELAQVWYQAPPGTTPAQLQALVDALLPPAPEEPGVVDVEFNGEFLIPECRQLTSTILELGPDAAALYPDQPALATMHGRRDPGLGAGVTVAVLDTGISRRHSLLAARLVTPGVNYFTLGGRDADDLGNGIDDNGDLSVDEGWGHGTAVAGLIHLVAPGAALLPVKVLDDECRGTAFTFAHGIVTAVNRGARVLNLSFGSFEKWSVVVKAVRWAGARGAILVAPAGNQGIEQVQFPATEDETVGVASVDDSLRATAFTSFGREVKLDAPGADLVTSWRDGWARVSGTSFSTALASGAAALAVQATPGASAPAIVARLQLAAISVDAANPGWDRMLGAGVPDLGRLRLEALLRGRVRPVVPVSIPAGAGTSNVRIDRPVLPAPPLPSAP